MGATGGGRRVDPGGSMKSVTDPNKNLLKDNSYIRRTPSFGLTFRPGW
jgi:hypothetical protein